ncbi:MAG: amino acid ABC transporter ATP-binding protein [Alcaligenaceae bacterium]|nr:amino acid ABC transporter ATP-binding protein [Alcaligenaceae bacterium]
MLYAESISKWYGSNQVLKNICLTVNRSEVLVIIGPSGSGKSTLCRTLCGIEHLDEGTVWIEGQPWAHRKQRGKPLMVHPNYREIGLGFGMVFQDYTLFPQMTALENVTLGPRKVLKLGSGEARKRGRGVLDRVGLLDRANAYPHELSGGQKQRVAIARELAMGRKILFLDEPTSALDPELVGEVLDVVASLARSGLTMVLVSHQMAFAKQAVDRVVFMADGEIVEIAAAQTFFSHPSTERAQRFVEKIA